MEDNSLDFVNELIDEVDSNGDGEVRNEKKQKFPSTQFKDKKKSHICSKDLAS